MKTVFIRAIEAASEAKSATLLSSSRGQCLSRIDIDVSEFLSIPQCPFAYWLPGSVRMIFARHESFDNETEGRTARCGLGTLDDFRFLRLNWEAHATADRWKTYFNGGTFSPFYEQTTLTANWYKGGREICSFVEQKVGSASRKVQGSEFYFKEGFYFPRRTKALCPKVMPSGGIFSTGGQAGFAPAKELLATIALMSSKICSYLIAVTQGRTGDAAQFEVGLIKRIPWPLGHEDFASFEALGRRAWSLTRMLDTSTEHSHAFVLPALLAFREANLRQSVRAWLDFERTTHTSLEQNNAEINRQAFSLYQVAAADRSFVEQGFFDLENDQASEEGSELVVQSMSGIHPELLLSSLLSWCLGVAFGRFDVRLASGERSAPPEPEPFDPLPVCSPGMLTGDDGLPLSQPPAGYPLAFPADGLLVDDPGHPQDLISAVRSVFEVVFDDADARWKEAAELLGTPELRSWFASEFFGPHIKRYSKSRRKAPIYWQFATPSGSYSIWLYIHRATADSLFRVLELVSQKLRHEEGKHAALLQEAGPSPSPSQRRELEQQESFLSELRGLKAEVARVAPLWRPDLDDGVLLNFAPLWRLVPQLSSWQTECRNAWDKLIDEHYDWAHLAMHLWPERVVPKCQTDRSLAIAHGLEDTLWFEDQDGTWRSLQVPEATVQQLIAERSSATVKAALADLRAAPAPVGRSTRRAARAPRSSTPRQPAAPAGPDPALLNQVQAAIGAVPEGASRADVLAATGISAAQWTAAIRALLAISAVIQTGERGGARYQLSGGRTP